MPGLFDDLIPKKSSAAPGTVKADDWSQFPVANGSGQASAIAEFTGWADAVNAY
jgi:hypothetical protein